MDPDVPNVCPNLGPYCLQNVGPDPGPYCLQNVDPYMGPYCLQNLGPDLGPDSILFANVIWIKTAGLPESVLQRIFLKGQQTTKAG